MSCSFLRQTRGVALVAGVVLAVMAQSHVAAQSLSEIRSDGHRQQGAGCDDATSGLRCAYVGAFVGSGRLYSRIVDVDGFANWGHRGWRVTYDDVELVGGALLGMRRRVGRVPLRFEVDGTFGDVLAMTNQLDPEGLDETAVSKLRWIATAGGGADHAIGPVTVFGTAGLAVARVTTSVTDIDVFRDRPPQVDPDDSFRDVSTDLGWVVRIGVETALSRAWALRLDGAYVAFGSRTHTVNRSGNNRCGPGGPQRPCQYEASHTLGSVRLGFLYRFDP